MLLVSGISVALVLTGCGDDDGGDTGAADESPLAEYFGEGVIEFTPGGGTGMSFEGPGEFEIPEEELDRMREVENLVAKCMADEGFEYTANVVNPDDYASPWQEAQQLAPDEFAEQYGYGISTMHYSVIEDDLPEDPNREYREALSGEALEAYEQALYGDMTAGGPQDEPPPVEERGCYGIASSEVYGDRVTETEERADPWSEFEGLMNDISSLSRRIHNDPRIEEAEQAWLECMAGAGYPEFQRVGEPETSIYQRMGEIEGWSTADSETETSPADASGDSRTAVQQPPEVDPDKLAELQEYEKELAVADHECMAEHYDDVFNEVSYEMQAEFVDEHRAELERYRAWAEKNDFAGAFGFGSGGAVSVD